MVVAQQPSTVLSWTNESEAFEKLLVPDDLGLHMTSILRGRKYFIEKLVIGNDFIHIRKSRNEVKFIYQSVTIHSAAVTHHPLLFRNRRFYGKSRNRMNLNLFHIIRF